MFDGVTFSSGLYIIASGNGKNTDGGLTIKGRIDGKAGVTFFFADNKAKFLSYAAAEGSVLYAPSIGITQGWELPRLAATPWAMLPLRTTYR